MIDNNFKNPKLLAHKINFTVTFNKINFKEAANYQNPTFLVHNICFNMDINFRTSNFLDLKINFKEIINDVLGYFIMEKLKVLYIQEYFILFIMAEFKVLY